MQAFIVLTYCRLKAKDIKPHSVFLLDSFCIKHTKAAKIGKSLKPFRVLRKREVAK